MTNPELELEFARVIREKNLLTREQVSQCIQVSQSPEGEGKSLGDIMVAQGFIAQNQVDEIYQSLDVPEEEGMSLDLTEGEDGEFSLDLITGQEDEGVSLDLITGDQPAASPPPPAASPPPPAASPPPPAASSGLPGYTPPPADGGDDLDLTSIGLDIDEDPDDISEADGDDLITSSSSFLGQVFGEIKLVSFFGEGSVGRTFRGANLQNGQSVTMKLIFSVVSSRDGFEQDLRDTIYKGKQVQSPFVIKIRGVGEERGITYIKYDYLSGSSLREVIKEENHIAPFEVVDKFQKWGQGVEAIHEQKLVHHNLNPGNLFIDKEGGHKIGDVGIPHIDDALRGRVTESVGQVRPDFVSPEIISGKDIDERTDIYSLGACMYFALVGEAPFKGNSHQELLDHIVQNTLEFPPKFHNMLSPSLIRLVQKMTSKEPWNRPENMTMVLEELKRVEKDIKEGRDSGIARRGSGEYRLPSGAMPNSSFEGAKGPTMAVGGSSQPTSDEESSQKVMVFALASLVLLVLLMGGGYYYYENYLAEKEPKQAKTGDPKVEKKDPEEDDKDKKDKEDKYERPKTEPPKKVIDEIHGIIKARELIDARHRLKALKKKYPKSVEVVELLKLVDELQVRGQGLFNEARYYRKRGLLPKAVVSIKKAFKVTPNNPKIRGYLQDCLKASLRFFISREKLNETVGVAQDLNKFGLPYDKWLEEWLEYQKKKILAEAKSREKKFEKELRTLITKVQDISQKNISRSEKARQMQAIQALIPKLHAGHYNSLLNLYRSKTKEFEELKRHPYISKFKEIHYSTINQYLTWTTKKITEVQDRRKK